ncbi:hypothetical protein [Leeuwenhoekiella marinoflava]|uniref:Uncharacterized protein n=2 Tax=Leeuwenhoekiella marinoflava TaxID=988 RepID=A0A4Q0PPX1_9FLAO|nr:hypothetical protein [Leeuwenhoekiella marinoflava]RXG32650.1 hypothetical protein DSL99_426 [Leeuwenhoekiella marinoflava]SHE52106.1 hypothetical protein SAMN02745246_00485 [Leeuwenhoekiella marinoflava DSM 3653]
MRIQLLVLLLCCTITSQAQVGIGTTDPKNDLHIEGGLRITNTPAGVDLDASQRVLATDENGDVVTVLRDQILKGITFPEVVYSAKYGTQTPYIPFFNTCENTCTAGTILRLNLVQPKIAYQKTSAISVIDPDTSTRGNEYFQISEDGYYTFEIQTSISLIETVQYYVNFYVEINRAAGGIETDILRIYAGIPAAGAAGSVIAAPVTFKDVKYYNAGDTVFFGFQPAFASNRIANDKPTAASYGAQLTVTKFQ